ncbi:MULTISPECIES: UDP-N-acetylmuramoyl-L-alanyl-D-glutamate--2,6-diaminopimelate ligase [Halomonadaceae]|uniref:UDP-N-acetylmuramoyl-L-alanyl-D-glutamate--2,6-diaminopimelate ligase n=1 Tax=Vreelandella halophila TaxID=86177 RepID=A0A9X4YCM6_9GAMM|nr:MULTISPECIES: UDP-N-acetylmuramoyl-L-alanyl-D-glutamate--2,6-diaminopimelate ligase [Halomonas]MYL26663.1 UDP-N-acetylmuramoyl-L-alanyl-D-glutamate--2,6-diaminopimelate ligase [Halomonas utahensis]MYL74000.1 UDP-N-acetylmuramoyl-L-alanyl-D-glutamate--2,6-diaminopimelate ligase [Halomonas sp. 22501_18_FS]
MSHVAHSLKNLLRDRAAIPSVLDVWVHGLSADSRRVRPGDAFIALAGSGGDAWAYVDDAVANGAVAILLEDGAGDPREYRGAVLVPVAGLGDCLAGLADYFHGHPSAHLTVIGVTGTNGKTSVTGFIAAILEAGGIPAATMGTLGYAFRESRETASHTTPDVTRVHSLLAGFLDQGAKAVVMEVSSHALVQGRVDRVRFDAGVFTNLSPEHLDYHADMAAYGAAKARLFMDHEPDIAVVNADDDFGRQLPGRLPAETRLWRYGYTAEQLECRIRDARPASDGMAAILDTRLGRLSLQTRLMGHFNIENLAAASAAALALGIPPGVVETAAAGVEAPPGRLEPYAATSGLKLVIDYAHTAAALEHALAALRPHVSGELWCVFGCGGNRDQTKRPAMGEVAERLADHVILTDDNPRDESPEGIVADILSGMADAAGVRVIHDRDNAITTAFREADTTDLVLIAGKGHETTQERGGVRTAFSDAGVVRRLIGEGGEAA